MISQIEWMGPGKTLPKVDQVDQVVHMLSRSCGSGIRLLFTKIGQFLEKIELNRLNIRKCVTPKVNQVVHV